MEVNSGFVMGEKGSRVELIVLTRKGQRTVMGEETKGSLSADYIDPGQFVICGIRCESI